jgi:hypothetical protein
MVNDVTLRALIPRRAREGLRVLPERSPATAFSPVRGDARRARPALARRGVLSGSRIEVYAQRRRSRATVRDGARDALLLLRPHRPTSPRRAPTPRARSSAAGTCLERQDRARGISCLAEQRMHRDHRARQARDPFHEGRRHHRDRDARRRRDARIFGRIEQTVVRGRRGGRRGSTTTGAARRVARAHRPSHLKGPRVRVRRPCSLLNDGGEQRSDDVQARSTR